MRWTPTPRPREQVEALVRGRIADGSLKPGVMSPSGPELAKETGFSARTCQAALRMLVFEGFLTRATRTARPRVAGGGQPGAGEELSRSLAVLRRAAGLTQQELAGKLGASVTTVGHAEQGRLGHSRRFWERADAALGAGGGLLALHDAWREDLAASAMAPRTAAEAAPDPPPGTDAVPALPGGIIITLPCDPVPVTVRWGDGSVTTMRPG